MGKIRRTSIIEQGLIRAQTDVRAEYMWWGWNVVSEVGRGWPANVKKFGHELDLWWPEVLKTSYVCHRTQKDLTRSSVLEGIIPRLCGITRLSWRVHRQ
jgi:hypothetical protein